MPEQRDRHRARKPRESRKASRRWGSLRGGAGVSIVAASAAVGAAVTIAHRAQPGRVLGVCIVVGTVIAALAVRPRAGRLIFPVPVLSYLIAALTAGIVYNRSTSKTELVIGAAQWIANGFLLMALATGLAIVLVTVRWILRRRDRRAPAVPDRSGSAGGISRRPRGGRDEYGTTGGPRDLHGPGGWNDPGSPAVPPQPGPQPGQRPPGSDGPGQRTAPYASQGNGQYPGQRPGQGIGPRPGPGSGQASGQRNGPRPGQDYGQYSGQGSAPRPGPGSGQPPEQHPGQGYGQYRGQGSGQAPGQRNGSRSGQRPEQRHGQGYGQYSGPGNGHYSGQGSGQAPGQGSGQAPGQGSGQAPGQRSGPDPDQRTGQRYGTYPGQRSAP